ncbi:hypothetical protein BN85409510 [Alteracholeplasma palmae J233]|uniref:Uncharacterized protein n=1 Tax=Alteracholeplasma palmae (strain ATCC 49389 / J233) TaxID=1318466 RepID=U4KL86_ALTPJ|nr:hypothetical protein [Alteracholeplasma palmae]CCV64528.1 hypothetical protein BN85409510 [Alteracholeplasma palmae J233]
MAKRNSSNASMIKFFVVILGVLAVLSIFLGAIATKDSDTVFTGLEATFGANIGKLGGLAELKLEFNFLALAAYFLPALGVIFIMVSGKRLGYLVSAVVFIGSAILLVTMPQYISVKLDTIIGGNESVIDWVLQWPVYVAVGLNGVAALTSVYLTIKE